MTTTKTALVLGPGGGLGCEATLALIGRGWRVRGLSRRPRPADAHPALEWVQADAQDRSAVIAAAAGAQLIVHAVNPPGYRDWDTLVLPMIDNTIAAARAGGARIILPGNVYNFGPDTGSQPDETAPQHPQTRKGAVRVALEARLQAATRDGVQSQVVRAGDFFGGRRGASNWFAQGLVKAGRPVTTITYPGRRGVGHAWAYLPDLAQTMAALAERPAQAPFEVFHFGGHYDADGTEMIAAIRAAVGRPNLPARAFFWPMVTMAAPFMPMLRELEEMRYLWREPLRLNNARLTAALGREPHTPWAEAARQTLVALGCLADDGASRAAA